MKQIGNRPENILLEYTATIDWNDQKICEKYLPKCLMMYDLKEFRQDKYSKEIKLFQYDEGIDKKDLILNAIILSQFKQDIAAENNINLKPVILFKANKTIEESKENFNLFQKIIKNLSIADLERLKAALFKHKKDDFDENGDYIDENYLISAFLYYEKSGFENLLRKLKVNFAETKCLDVNEYTFDSKKQSLKNFEKNKSVAIYQENILNSLENFNNEYRAIFAVNKLNEGWDVLNLFDIVLVIELDKGCYIVYLGANPAVSHSAIQVVRIVKRNHMVLQSFNKPHFIVNFVVLVRIHHVEHGIDNIHGWDTYVIGILDISP